MAVQDAGQQTCVEVSLTVTNTGTRAGREIVQVYVTDPECTVFRPEQELKGFATVNLEPGQSEQVSVTLDARAFSYWNVALGALSLIHI